EGHRAGALLAGCGNARTGAHRGRRGIRVDHAGARAGPGASVRFELPGDRPRYQPAARISQPPLPHLQSGGCGIELSTATMARAYTPLPRLEGGQLTKPSDYDTHR